jgi:hypothetical protein
MRMWMDVGVVVGTDADGTGVVAFEEPLVDAGRVEDVVAGQIADEGLWGEGVEADDAFFIVSGIPPRPFKKERAKGGGTLTKPRLIVWDCRRP